MLKIHVLPGLPKVQEGTSSKTGRAYKIVTQAAAVEHPSGVVETFSLRLRADESPYKPGVYALAAESFYVRDGELNLSPRLVSGGGTNASK